MMSKKILVLGVEQNNFLSFLYSSLKNKFPEFEISAPYINIKNEYSNSVYTNHNIKGKASILSFINAFLYIVTSKHFYQTFLFILLIENKIKKTMYYFFISINEKAFFIENKNFKSYDTFHFHYMQFSYLRELFYVPKNKKIVCSFWGSDLLRTSDTFNQFFVKKALNRSTVITCQSTELKEIILSKYGRNLEEKTKINIFPLDNYVYKEMDNYNSNINEISLFKKKYGYSLDKLNVLIGHNGNPLNNHIKCIDELQKSTKKADVHLIINLNYALPENQKESYKKDIISSLEESGITYVLLEIFFSRKELSISRLATDIFIHMPVSDALSGTMMEMIYSDTVVMTGSWLPYNTFRELNIIYHGLSEFNKLSSEFDLIVKNYDQQKELIAGNKIKIRDYFFNEKIVHDWAKILN